MGAYLPQPATTCHNMSSSSSDLMPVQAPDKAVPVQAPDKGTRASCFSSWKPQGSLKRLKIMQVHISSQTNTKLAADEAAEDEAVENNPVAENDPYNHGGT